MKAARFLLLVLLAVLLPLRGALADVAHCATGSATTAADVSAPLAPPGPHGDAHATGHHHAIEASQAPAGHLQAGEAHAADNCNLCTVSCSTTPFASAAPSLTAPASIAAGPYPALIAPPPSHSSEGQERPPRSV